MSPRVWVVGAWSRIVEVVALPGNESDVVQYRPTHPQFAPKPSSPSCFHPLWFFFFLTPSIQARAIRADAHGLQCSRNPPIYIHILLYYVFISRSILFYFLFSTTPLYLRHLFKFEIPQFLKSTTSPTIFTYIHTSIFLYNCTVWKNSRLTYNLIIVIN